MPTLRRPKGSPLAAELQEKVQKSLRPRHLIVKALAGTGKTSSFIQGLRASKGLSTEWEPSSQQAAIWQYLRELGNVRYLRITAFNVSIAKEAKALLPNVKGWGASTLNSMGWSTCRYTWKDIELNQYKTDDAIEKITGKPLRVLRKDKMEMVAACKDLVRLCKQKLLDPTDENFDDLVSHHAISMPSDDGDTFELARDVLTAAKENVKEADFPDQLWLPVVHGVRPFQNDLLIVDEGQDLNRCQQEYALSACKTLALVGDNHQAIYGFAGADVESIGRMQNLLENVDVLPLTMTRRCGHEIVKRAQQIVPEYEAHESNCLGSVSQTDEDHYNPQPGEMNICRVNAPLIGQAFDCIRNRKPATVLGRDIGEGLLKLVDNISHGADVMPVENLIGDLDDWCHNEVVKLEKRRHPSVSAIEGLRDKVNCVVAIACTKEARNAGDVKKIFRTIFEGGGENKVIFSSIHKAKGLEAKVVNILKPHLLPHPMAKQKWEQQQERNLEYVAVTRAIEELNFVVDIER